MSFVSELAEMIVPPLCCACGKHTGDGSALCGGCLDRLSRQRPVNGDCPQGVDRIWSAVPYEGVARDLVGALKFRQVMTVAEVMADRIVASAPLEMLEAMVVPVPAAPRRQMARGYDPGGEVAHALHYRHGMGLAACLARRDSGRQVGRARSARVSAPPRIECPNGCFLPEVLLVDDVTTTGATLAACARALRGAGAARVDAITFARRR